MDLYFFVGGIILIIEIILYGYLIMSMFSKKTAFLKEKIVYMAISVFLIYIIYTAGAIYNSSITGINKNSFFKLLDLINTSLHSFVFHYDIGIIEDLMSQYTMYAFLFILSILYIPLCLVNLINSVFKNRIVNAKNCSRVFNMNGDIILGDSESAREYLKNNSNALIWDDSNCSKETIDLGYTICKEKLCAKNLHNKLKKGEYHLILFKDSKYNYADSLNIFEETINLEDEKQRKQKALFLHIESNIEQMQALKEHFISKVSEEGNYFVSCFNKYELIARQFIMENPISKYIPRDFFNKSNYTLKQDKQINVVFLGFGNINAELFKMMSITCQFAKEDKKNNKFVSSPVNYYIYDFNKNKLYDETLALVEVNLDKVYKNASLPKMDKICNLIRKDVNVNSLKIREEIEGLINKDSFTCIVVSMASDLENIAYCDGLKNHLGEGNYKIFARVKESVLYRENNQDTIYFGKESQVLTHEKIVNEDLIELSQRTNLIHSSNAYLSSEDLYNWQKLILIKQYDNIYQALSMFFKLNLMGIDIVKKDRLGINENYQVLTKDEYERIYRPVDYKRIKYEDYKGTKINNMFGFIEHQRWNAFYFLSGYKPMNFEEFQPIEKDKRRPNQLHGVIKKHACLTNNYQGLDTLIKTLYLMDKYGKDYKKHRVSKNDIASKEFMEIAKIYYCDFMVMDCIYDIFDIMEYILVKRK